VAKPKGATTSPVTCVARLEEAGTARVEAIMATNDVWSGLRLPRPGLRASRPSSTSGGGLTSMGDVMNNSVRNGGGERETEYQEHKASGGR